MPLNSNIFFRIAVSFLYNLGVHKKTDIEQSGLCYGNRSSTRE